MRKALYLIPALALGLTTAVTAQTVQTFPNTLPATYAGNSWPFNNTTTTGFRTQFIYDGSNISAKSPVLIQRIRMRRSSLTATNTGLLNGVTISLSTSPVAWNALTTTFANHVGKDVKVVFKGNLVCNATAWYVDIKLTTPFLYDPTQGGLCFDFVRGPTPTAGNTYPGSGGYSRGTAAAPFKANRIWGSPTSATGSLDSGTTVTNGYANTAEVTWIPAKGLYSSFSADKTSGPGPLTVQFKDTTYTSSAGGVKGWAWDFNGDSKTDSTLQNPKWTFPKTTWDRQWDVSLTTVDGVHPTSKTTVKAFITVDPSDAFAVNFGNGSSNKPLPVPIEVSANTSHYVYIAVRGFHFQAPTTLVINGFEAPNDHATKQTDQTVTCYVLSKAPPAFAASYTPTAAEIKFHGTGKANTVLKPAAPIIVQKGQWVAVLGACHGTAATANNYNSYGAGNYKSTVMGLPITLQRIVMQVNHRGNKGAGPISTDGAGSIARVFIHVAGNNSVPSLDTIGAPSLGKSATLDLVGRVPGAQGGVVFLSTGRLPAPVPTAFGNLLVVPNFPASFAVAGGTGKLTLPIPSDNNLKGVKLDWQALVFNLTTKTYGMSNGSEWFLGK